MKQKFFVLSLDAMVREDVEYMMTKPNFRRIMEKRAEVDKVRSVFPSPSSSPTALLSEMAQWLPGQSLRTLPPPKQR